MDFEEFKESSKQTIKDAVNKFLDADIKQEDYERLIKNYKELDEIDIELEKLAERYANITKNILKMEPKFNCTRNGYYGIIEKCLKKLKDTDQTIIIENFKLSKSKEGGEN